MSDVRRRDGRLRRQRSECRLNGRKSVLKDALMRWTQDGFPVNICIRPVGLLLAIAYGLAYWSSRQISHDPFFLPAGIRVAALLLCPPRLWPYLLLGEIAQFWWQRHPFIDRYGIMWMTLAPVFLLPAVSLVVHLHRRLIEQRADVWLFSVAAASSVATTVINLSVSALLWPDALQTSLAAKAERYIVGDFIGILTVAPLALLWVRRHVEAEWTSRFLAPAMLGLTAMAVLGFSASWATDSAGNLKQYLQIAMVVPAIVMTRMLGWRGAALSVPLLGLVIGLSLPCAPGAPADPATLMTAQIILVVGISLLALGASISGYYERLTSKESAEKFAVRHARGSHMSGELGLRERAIDINRIGDRIDAHLSETADWLKRQGHARVAEALIDTSVVYSRKFREQASMVYPTALEHLGLYLALQVSGISEAWADTDRIVPPRLVGDPCGLSVGLQLAAYRTLTEAVSLILQNEPGQARVHARCGYLPKARGMLIKVELLDRNQTLSTSTVALALERLTGRTLAYGGSLRCRRNRICMLFTESTDTHRLSLMDSTAQTVSPPDL